MLSKSLTNVLRGIAVILIVVCHFIGGGFEIRYFTPLGGIGVSIFLFLSGYGLNESYLLKGLDGYWWKKIIRVVIPYFIWCGLLALTVWLLPYDSPVFRRYWYLEYLFLWYSIFWISKKFIPKYADLLMIVITVCLFPFLRNIQSEQSFSFVLGVLVSDWKEKLYNKKGMQWFIWATLCMLCGMFFLYLKQIPIVRAFGEESVVVKLVQLGIKLPCGLGIIIFVSKIYRDNLFWRLWGFLGVVSLELYLVQMPFPDYIQGSWLNLVKILGLVSILTILLHYAILGTNFLMKKINLKTNQ